MTKRKMIYVGVVAIMLLLVSAGCASTVEDSTVEDSTVEDSTTIQEYGFFVEGVSGDEVMLDRTWYQECASGGEGVWMTSVRTMSGKELSTTVTEYQNGSATPDCTNASSSVTIFVQTLTNDNIRVPITWVDAAGTPTDAPAGLEGVTEGNGASGLITYAVITPITQAKVDQLNGFEFCGKTDWDIGVTSDILPCFPVNPAKGTVIVDDRTNTGVVYDGFSVDPTEYPTFMPIASHEGPLTQIQSNN